MDLAHPRGTPRRAAHRADPHRVHPAGDVPAPAAAGAGALVHPRGGVGLRLPDHRQLAGGLRRLPAPQDRGRGRAAAAPHRARRRLRARRRHDTRRTRTGPRPGPSARRWHYRRSLASRVALLTTSRSASRSPFMALGAFVTVRMQMQSTLDESLLDRADKAAKLQRAAEMTAAATSRRGCSAPPTSGSSSSPRTAASHRRRPGPSSTLGAPELEVAAGQPPGVGAHHHATAGVRLPRRRRARRRRPARWCSRSRWSRRSSTLRPARHGDAASSASPACSPPALAGWAVARNGLRPVRRLTASVEEIARTEELRPLAVEGDDEIARLADGVQPDARRARRLPRPAAPAGRRRRPRAAHAADLAAHQPRPARPGRRRRRPAGRGPRASCSTTSAPRSRSYHPRRRPGRARPRRAAPARRRAGRPRRGGRAGGGAGTPPRPRRRLRRRPRAVVGRSARPARSSAR